MSRLRSILDFVVLAVVAGAASAHAQTPGDILFKPPPSPLRILVVPVYYQDDPTPVSGYEQAALDLEDHYRDFFYDEIDVVVTVVLPILLPKNKACYTDPEPTPVRLRADIKQILSVRDGIQLDVDYDREIILSADNIWGDVPRLGFINWRTVLESTANLPPCWGHETGHSFDLQHATAWQAPTNQPPDYEGSGAPEHHNPYDTMGLANFTEWRHFNPWWKWRKSWLHDADIELVSTTTAGVYEIQALELDPLASSRKTALRIPEKPGRDVWVYYRKDQTPDGVMVEWGYRQNFRESFLLDMDMGARTEVWTDAALTVEDPPFVDSAAGFTIETLEVNATEGWARVSITPPNPVNPPLDILPVMDVTSPSPGQTLTGSSVTYTVTAYDPDQGAANGNGIAKVEFWLYPGPPTDELRICLENGGLPCAGAIRTGTDTAKPYTLAVDFTSPPVPDRAYILVVRATSKPSAGGGNNVHWFPHLLDRTGPYPSGCPATCGPCS